MPFVRTAKGTKTKFSIAKLSAMVTQAYLDGLGAPLLKWRPDIQTHTQRIYRQLQQQGDGPTIEWTWAVIQEAVRTELQQKAPATVYDAFLEQIKSSKPSKPQEWGEFYSKIEPETTLIDPEWSVTAPTVLQEFLPEPPAQLLTFLGEPARIIHRQKRIKPLKPITFQARRSHWIEFWQSMGRHAQMPYEHALLEQRILKLPPDLKQWSPEQWWVFWYEEIHQLMKKDPRFYGLLKVMQQLQETSKITGEHWFENTCVIGGTTGPLLHQTHPQQREHYQSFFKDYLSLLVDQQLITTDFLNTFSIKTLAEALEPERDQWIDWRGWNWLITSESLWEISNVSWLCQPLKSHIKARELPQWGFMRLAMALAIRDENPTEKALLFYDAFSKLAVIPSETLLREGGKKEPIFLEDCTGYVRDDFDAIHDTIHKAAVQTKWTGTMTLQWDAVRPQGVPIGGRRLSQGPTGFLKSIHSSLAAQGRTHTDRPVSVTLPLWHRDIESFIGFRKEADRLQTVVTVPDLFFERLQNHQPWYLVDPSQYPDILCIEKRPGLFEAWDQKTPKNIKVINIETLWRKLVHHAQNGFPYFTFENSNHAFSPFPLSSPGHVGIDGVGSIPVPQVKTIEPHMAWPSMAINLSKSVDDEGQPKPDYLKNNVYLALEMLDNAIEQSHGEGADQARLYRPVCLGVVGFYEAVEKGTAKSHHDPTLIDEWVATLAEAWASVVISGDQKLRRKRGAAPIWKIAEDARPFDPLGSLERLKISRKGSLGHRPKPSQFWDPQQFSKGHRFSARTVWAPYSGAAKIAGVTQGGMGTLRLTDQPLDEQGTYRLCPAPLLLDLCKNKPDHISALSAILQFPQQPQKWPSWARDWSYPTAEGWQRRLHHASLIRPWVDQGVSLTLPTGLKPELLKTLIKQAWWLGLSNIRFEEQEGHANTLHHIPIENTEKEEEPAEPSQGDELPH